jgi:DUF4097 and DUF4098 domain-containing protein YvlB
MSNPGTPNTGTPGPAMTPPPIPPGQWPPRRRSFAGPFVLILLGVIFLLGNLHMLSWSRLGSWFAHYWPALLIVWGVIKLIEYQQAQRQGTSPPRIGAGGIFLVIVIVVCGLIATQASRFNWASLRDQINIDDEDINNIFGDNYNFDDHLEQNFPAGAALKIIDTHGGVSVHASDDNKITVIVRKRIGADNQNDANKYDEKTRPAISTIGGLVTLDARADAAGDHTVITDLDVSLPKKAVVTISSRRGDVTLAIRDGDVDISSQHGEVSVEEVKGNVKLNLQSSAAKVEQIGGDVHIEGRLNEVSVTDVKGGAQLDGEFMESVKLSRIANTVSFKSSRTDMSFSKIDGDLDLDSDDLRAERVGGPVRLTTRSKNIRLEDVSGDVRMQDSNGGVEVGMRSPGNVQIDNRQGDIQVSVPDKPGFRLEARTRDGEIQSDFSELKVDNSDREAHASGQVGNGAVHIVLNNEHGGIEIRRAAISGGPKEGIQGGIPGGIRGPKELKPGKSLPAPKEKVEPTEN